MNASDVEAMRENLAVLQGLCREYLDACDDPQLYSHTSGLSKPRGVNWVEYSEATCEQLAADIEVRVRRLAEHAGLLVSTP